MRKTLLVVLLMGFLTGGLGGTGLLGGSLGPLGGSASGTVTTIAGTKCSVIRLPIGVQIGIIYDNAFLKCIRSKDHFATVDEETIINSGVDDCQPGVYASGMTLYAAAFKLGALTVWKSVDLGRLWTEQGAI